MTKITIDREKCIKCGLCMRDCISYCIEFDDEGYPRQAEGAEDRCLSCRHCLAICPTGALSFNGESGELEGNNVNYGNPEEVLSLIKSRKSFRQYKEDEEISPELLSKLKEMLPFVPTGCNTNTLHFSFIETKSAMDTIREEVRQGVLKLISNKFVSKHIGKLSYYKEAFEKGEDIIFRGAPHMIIVSSSIKAPCVNVDPIIALSYLELYAQSLGLGTCWCGFAQTCLMFMPELCKAVNIPDGYKPVYAMLLGVPAVKYQRTIQPDSFPISEIKDAKFTKMSFTEKARRFLLNCIR